MAASGLVWPGVSLATTSGSAGLADTMTVEKLDATGIRLVRCFAGVPVQQLSHTWAACEGHTHYVSVLEVGSIAPCSRP